MNMTKYKEKRKRQELVNPGHKKTYQQPFRGRAAVFADKSKYTRDREKRLVEKLYLTDL